MENKNHAGYNTAFISKDTSYDLNIPFCSFNALVPHITDKFPSPISNWTFHWESTVIDHLDYAPFVSKTLTNFLQKINKNYNTSSSSESC